MKSLTSTRLGLPGTALVILLVLALAGQIVVFSPDVQAKGRPQAETPATADLLEHPDASSNPPACGSGTDSVFEDGGGPYTPDDGTYFRSNGDLWVQALSGSNREMDLYLPAHICALLKPGAWAKSGVKLSIQAVRDVPDDGTPYIVGQSPLEGPNYTLGHNHYFYWFVDSTGDGKIGRGDTSYNVVWQDGISVTRTGNVYVLDTAGTSQMAVLRYTVGKTVYLSPEFYMPLQLTVTRQ